VANFTRFAMQHASLNAEMHTDMLNVID